MKSNPNSNSKKSLTSSSNINSLYQVKNNYHNYSSTVVNMNTSIPMLEQQLRMLKQEQKKYNKLTAKLKEIEKKSKEMAAQEQAQGFTVFSETQQIENLKKQIQECIRGIRKLQSQTNEINKQIEQSNKQLNSLQHMLNALREQNLQKRNSIKDKGLIYQQKERNLNNILKQRDTYQNEVDNLRAELQRLTNQEYKLRKQAQIVQFQQLQQEKAARKCQDHLEKLKHEKIEIQTKVGTMTSILANEQQKYKGIKEQLAILSMEQNELVEEAHRKQSANRENKEKIIRSRAKIELLTQQIQNTEHDLKLLSSQYRKQTDRLKELEVRNSQLNQQLDQSCKDAKQVWESLREALDVAAGNEDIWSLDNLMKLRSQAFEVWNQIQAIIQ